VNSFATEWELEQTTATANPPHPAPVFAVVGFDGSAPTLRALDGAAWLLRDRVGGIEIVHVAHVPATAARSADAVGESVRGLDDANRHLAAQVRAHLAGTEPRWHYQRRDGNLADQLLAAADDLRRQQGPDAAIVIVVGASVDRCHPMVGSVGHSLEQSDRYPTLVVP
jgi:nucleotide-binding universal stress UspA family protein